MRKKLRGHSLAATILILLCVHVFAQAQSQNDQELMNAYNNAIYDASVYKFSNLRPLKKLEFDPQTHTARVVTLTDFPYTLGVTKPLPVEVWVTAVPEVQDACQRFKGDIALRLRQLLGLPPAQKFTHFVVLTVKQGDIFRPAVNPNPTTTFLCDCPIDWACGKGFSKDISQKELTWLANQMLGSYAISESTQTRNGFPWTRLGYTYDWSPGSGKYGASEFVIWRGSVVTVEEIIPYETYCRPK